MVSTDELNFDCTTPNLNICVSQCDYCGDIFESKRPNKYCSNSCRQSAYYVRNGLRKDSRKHKPSDRLLSATGLILGFHKSEAHKTMDENHKAERSETSTDNTISKLEQEVKRLEKLVAHSTLKTVALEEMIAIAEHYFNIPIRKKRGAKQ